MAAQDYSAYNEGVDRNVFLKKPDGSVYKGRVWPGATAFPDWFHPNTQAYWDDEFMNFFHKDTGVDIDGLWIDMNEPSNFCEYPCGNSGAEDGDKLDAVSSAEKRELQIEVASESGTEDQVIPPRTKKAKLQHDSSSLEAPKFAPPHGTGFKKGLPGRDLIDPKYKIKNKMGSLSNKTADTDLMHYGGYAEYDTHNL